MLRLANGSKLVESLSELPQPPSINELFLDTETTSATRTQQLKDPMALHPYAGDRICGIALTWDDHDSAYYIPIRHSSPGAKNLELSTVLRWLRDIMKVSKKWVNHNVKFDAHMVAVEGISFEWLELIDTTTLSKTLDSDRFNHKLKPLCKDWLGLEMSEADEVASYLKGIKSKDFGKVPIDILGKYACMDVLGNRQLWKYLQENKPEELSRIWKTEMALTPVLFDIERRGFVIDKKELRVESFLCLKRMLGHCETVREAVGVDLVDSNDCFHEIIVTQLGLPILARTDTGKSASFDKEAMILYAGHPEVIFDEKKARVIEALRAYRTEERFKSLYLDSWIEKADVNGVIRPNYNQLIRTGRMAGSDPNPQQLNIRAKKLVKPRAGYGFGVQDAKQIEFRLIVHLTKNPAALAAYAQDKNTDFHTYISVISETSRSPAKTLNFTMAYGAGRRTVTRKVAFDKDIMAKVAEEVQAEIDSGSVLESARAMRYSQLSSARADVLYDRYHAEFPEIKETSERARILCMTRGYIRNAYGRRRHLPSQAAHKAFNSSVQGLAMDIIKERMVALSPRHCDWTRENDIHEVANVHDELLEEMPVEVGRDPATHAKIVEILEDVQYPFRVPILWDHGYSEKNWAEAKG